MVEGFLSTAKGKIIKCHYYLEFITDVEVEEMCQSTPPSFMIPLQMNHEISPVNLGPQLPEHWDPEVHTP